MFTMILPLKKLLNLRDDLLEKNVDILDKTIVEAVVKNGASSKENDSLTGTYTFRKSF